MGVSEMKRTSGIGKLNRLSVAVLAGGTLAVVAMVASGDSLAFSHNPFREQETQPC